MFKVCGCRFSALPPLSSEKSETKCIATRIARNEWRMPNREFIAVVVVLSFYVATRIRTVMKSAAFRRNFVVVFGMHSEFSCVRRKTTHRSMANLLMVAILCHMKSLYAFYG